MGVYLTRMFGSTSIGVYSLAADSMVIVPKQIPKTRAEKIGEWLQVEIVRTNIGGSVLIGTLLCANSNGIIIPHYVRDEELKAVKSASDVNVTIMEFKRTAYGNLILANDYGAIVSPELSEAEVRLISDTLGVEAVRGTIAGLPYVGSLATATNRGVLAHPKIREDEAQLLRETLKVQVESGTVNCGVPYVAMGLIANSYGAVAGLATTGREMAVISHALGVM